MAGLDCIGTEHHQLTDAEEKGAVRSAGLRGAQESDLDEQPDYLLLDILQHVPTEKAERLLSCLSGRERALEDVLRRNRELVGSCAAGAPAPPPDALGGASCRTDSASSCGANTPRCWRGGFGRAPPSEPAPEKSPRAGPAPLKGAVEPRGLGVPPLAGASQGLGVGAPGALPLEGAVQQLEANHRVLAALVLHLSSSVGALDLLHAAAGLGGAGGLGGAAGGRGARFPGGVAQGKAPPGALPQQAQGWAQRVEALEAQLAQVGGAAEEPRTPRMWADPQRHLARQVLQKEHSWAQRVRALEARLAQVQAERELGGARRGAQRSPRELSTPRERRLRNAFSSPRLGSSWADLGFGDSPISARRGAHRSPLSPPWEGWRTSLSSPMASSPFADFASDFPTQPTPPPRASNARAGQLLSARQRPRGQQHQKAAQQERSAAPADGARTQPAASPAAAWGFADYLRTSAAAMWEATARLLSSGRAAAEPEDAAGSSSSSSCSSSSSSLSDTEPL